MCGIQGLAVAYGPRSEGPWPCRRRGEETAPRSCPARQYRSSPGRGSHNRPRLLLPPASANVCVAPTTAQLASTNSLRLQAERLRPRARQPDRRADELFASQTGERERSRTAPRWNTIRCEYPQRRGQVARQVTNPCPRLKGDRHPVGAFRAVPLKIPTRRGSPSSAGPEAEVAGWGGPSALGPAPDAMPSFLIGVGQASPPGAWSRKGLGDRAVASPSSAMRATPVRWR